MEYDNNDSELGEREARKAALLGFSIFFLFVYLHSSSFMEDFTVIYVIIHKIFIPGMFLIFIK